MSAISEGCVTVPLQFHLSKFKQKSLVDFLCCHSKISHDTLANCLGVTKSTLNHVRSGDAFLNSVSAEQLVRYFCIFCGE